MWTDFNWNKKLFFFIIVMLNFRLYFHPFKFFCWHRLIPLECFSISKVLSKSENNSLSPFVCIHKLASILQNSHLSNVNVNGNIPGKQELELILNKFYQEVEQSHSGPTMRSMRSLTPNCPFHLWCLTIYQCFYQAVLNILN